MTIGDHDQRPAPYGPMSASQEDAAVKTDLITVKADIIELKDKTKLLTPESMSAMLTKALKEGLAAQTTPPAWASGLTGSISSLQEEQTNLKNKQDALERKIAALEREINAVAKIGHPIYLNEETAKLHTAHILRLSNFGEHPAAEIERYCKQQTDKFPNIPTPTIKVKSDHTKLIFLTAEDARTFSRGFLGPPDKPEKPALNGAPIYCRQELPGIVLETQRPLNQSRHAYRQSLGDAGKNAKIKIDWKKRVLYDNTTIIAFQKLDGTIDVDHLLDESLADTLRAASVAKDYFKTAKQKAGPKGVGKGGGKGAGKGKAAERDAKLPRNS